MLSAINYSKLSTAKKLHVGCVIVKNNNIIGIGYNGMPSGWNNTCEREEYAPKEHYLKEPFSSEYPHRRQIDKVRNQWVHYKLVSLPEVLHAETNAISKVARSNESSEGASLYTTHEPCLHCAKLIYQSGISRVLYANEYEKLNNEGIEFLEKCGVEVSIIDV
jgi:dCMP deaminase